MNKSDNGFVSSISTNCDQEKQSDESEASAYNVLFKLFINSEYIYYGAGHRNLVNRINALISPNLEQIRDIIKNKQNLKLLMEQSNRPVWLQNFIDAVALDEIKFKGGQHIPKWAQKFDITDRLTNKPSSSERYYVENLDVKGVFKYLSDNTNYPNKVIYQFLADELKVPGFNEESEGGTTIGSNTVRSYVNR